jgi:hypothetical protein
VQKHRSERKRSKMGNPERPFRRSCLAAEDDRLGRLAAGPLRLELSRRRWTRKCTALFNAMIRSFSGSMPDDREHRGVHQ